MIKSIKDKPTAIEIDLTGPLGNDYVLLGFARNFCKQLGRNYDEVRGRMTSGDYDNLVKVFEEEFGDFVTLYR